VRPQRRTAPPAPVRVTAAVTCPIGGDGDDGRVLLTVVGSGGKPESGLYYVREIPTPLGRGFSLRKVAGNEDYSVLVAGRESTCRCRGFCYHGHCRHVSALSALVARGDI
jgi:hypothetical protein